MLIQVPVGETIWVQYVNNGVVTHIITSTKMRDCYYLYKVVNSKAIKTKYKAESPTQLEKYVTRKE